MNKFKVRPLGANEKVFWVLDQKSMMHFAIAAEIEGQAPVEDWRHALDTVQQYHPVLSTSITGGAYTNACLEQVSDCPIPLRVVDYALGEEWNDELEAELGKPFNLLCAPLVRTILIRQPGKSIFIFVSNHSIGDGIAVSLVIRDILAVLSGRSLKPMPQLPSLDELLDIPVKPIPLEKQLSMPVVQYPKNRSAVKIDRLLLPAKFVEQLYVRTKVENVTVHCALTAACIIAGRRLSQEWYKQPVRILHPASIRNTLQLGDDYGLLANFLLDSYDPVPDMAFWDLAREVKASIAITRTLDWNKNALTVTSSVFNGGMELEVVDQVLNQTFDHQLLLTNLGRINYSTDFGNLTLRTLWGPMVLAPANSAQTIGVATTNGEMALTLTSHRPIKGLLEAMRKTLAAAFNKVEYAKSSQLIPLSL
jgi:hypothetical protein